MEFPRFLKRHRRGMTQAELAHAAGVLPDVISKLETSAIQPACTKTILKILEALQLSREDFIDGVRSAGYDVNIFPLPTFRGTNDLGMRTIETWAGEYYDATPAHN